MATAAAAVKVVGGVLIASLFYWFFLSSDSPLTPSKDQILAGIQVQPELQLSSKLLPEHPSIVKVVDGVYVAVGFSTGNSILLEGTDELVIVDTAESVDAASEMLREFRKITTKPIRAIIYTHNHADHITGAPAFVEDAEHPPEIWAHQSLKPIILSGMSVGAKAYRGIVHQFGLQLGHYMVSFFNLRLDVTKMTLPLFPTKFVDDAETLDIPGLRLTLLHLPGETSDQVEVWLPERRVLMAGDNVYKCFPNLYAVRGTPPRSSLDWAQAVRRTRSLNAQHLVLSHGLPVSGSDEIYDLLTAYMSGILFVHDQTVRLINAGLHPDVIAKRIQLPPSLASHPYLRQCYGMTGWASKGIYEEYLGWFSGDPVELQPLTPEEKATRTVRMVGEKKLISEAREALERKDFQWALELSSTVLRVDGDHSAAKALRTEALRCLAGEQINPTARNFYMTSALDDYGLVSWQVDQTKVIEQVDMKVLMNLLRFKLKAEQVHEVNSTILFRFTDTEEAFRLQILHSVLDVQELTTTTTSSSSDEQGNSSEEERGGSREQQQDVEEDGVDAKVLTTSRIWREILSKKLSPLTAVARGDVKVITGGVNRLKEFFSYFQT